VDAEVVIGLANGVKHLDSLVSVEAVRILKHLLVIVEGHLGKGLRDLLLNGRQIGWLSGR
jgi:hypothetical protein